MVLSAPRPSLLPLLVLVCLLFGAPRKATAGPAEALERAAMEHLGAVQGTAAEPPHPFTSDGCSGGLSAAWHGATRLLPGFATSLGEAPPWEDCCVVHDRAYWLGEARGGYELRLAADDELRRCVSTSGVELGSGFASRLGVPEQRVVEFFALAGELMYAAVRAGGGPCTGLPWRWGYGWPHCLPGAVAPPP